MLKKITQTVIILGFLTLELLTGKLMRVTETEVKLEDLYEVTNETSSSKYITDVEEGDHGRYHVATYKNTITDDLVFRATTRLQNYRNTDYYSTVIECDYDPTQEEIEEEIELGEMELLAQLCQAEAGNQGLTGMRYVADVVLNRVDSEKFPDTVEEVIYQTGPVQFTTTVNGALDQAGWNISEEAFLAAKMEWEDRLDDDILYFSTTPTNGHGAWQYGNHWFSY